jgi:hypothetical protein
VKHVLSKVLLEGNMHVFLNVWGLFFERIRDGFETQEGGAGTPRFALPQLAHALRRRRYPYVGDTRSPAVRPGALHERADFRGLSVPG